MAMDIVKKTQKKVEKSKKKLAKTIELKSYKKLAVNFLILSINLIIIIIYFSLSQAIVVIIPSKNEISHNIELPIVTDGDAENDDSGLSIPGQIAEIEVSVSETFTIDSTTEVPSTAEGTLTILNTTKDRTQTFVKNTRFVNEEGVELKIKSKVDLAPGKSITTAAYASLEGDQGNVSEGRFQVAALPYLKDSIYAEPVEPFTGGTINIKAVTIDAYNSAKDEVENKLSDKAWEMLSEAYSDLGQRENMTLEVAELQSSANPGDKNIEEFIINAEAIASVFSYNEKRAKEIIKQQIIKRIPADMVLVNFIEDSYTVEFNPEQKIVTASIDAKTQPKISEFALNKEDIIGMNQEEVREHFTKITGIEDVEIKFSPFWVRSVPNLKDHVDIEIKK